MEEVKHDSVLDARESVEIEDFLTDLKWQGTEIDGQWLDPSEEYRRPEYTLSYKGIPFAPLGGIHGLTGQPGHGKTFTFTQLMLAILRGDYFGLKYEQSENIPNPKVLYIDTEMEKGNTQLVMLRIYDQMGWQIGSMHDEFRILWLREVTKAEERWRMVLKAIWTIRPTVVFLDGLIDVIGDFNDNKECQQIIYQCMACASHYRVSMWCLLHENPGSDKMVGHAGSFLERKATDVLKTKKDKTGATPYFTVTQNKARSRDLPDWHFTIEDDEHHYGHPVLADGEQKQGTQATDSNEPTDAEVFSAIKLIGKDTCSFTALRERIKKAQNIGSGKAGSIINIGVTKGYLTCTDNKYSITNQEWLDGDEELPF